MTDFVLDTETCLFRPGVMAPELVCVSWCFGDEEPQLTHWTEAEGLLHASLARGDRWVGHNIAYDSCVCLACFPSLRLPLFKAYDEDRVTDTMLRAQLLDIAGGCYRGRFEGDKWRKYGYSLDDCIHRVRGERLDKDTWRLRYGEFRSTPLSAWPEGARQYPLEDARATRDVKRNQEPHEATYLADQYRQSRAYFALQLSHCWGIRTDAHGVEVFEREMENEKAQLQLELEAAGLVRSNGSRNMKAAMEAMERACERLNVPVARTDGGKPSLEKDSCDRVKQDPVMHAYSQYQTTAKVLSNDVPMLKAGTVFPVHPHYGLADTGRSTCTNPNIQALRRKKGIREAFKARPGKVFAQADFEGLELHTLAQVCKVLVGYSKLGDVLNSGKDAHSALAADILSAKWNKPITYEEVLVGIKDKASEWYDARQASKVANFGFPVGLGPPSLVSYARKTYGVVLDKNEQEAVNKARILKVQWLERWTEMQEYFDKVSRMCEGPDGLGTIEQLFVKRHHGGVRYTAACSGFSQGLGGDAAKAAVWEVTKAQFTDEKSPLYCSHIVAFVHDELIVEVDDNNRAHDAAIELSRLMCQGANRLIPDYPVEAPPLLMRVWSKEAKALRDTNNRLIPWSP